MTVILFGLAAGAIAAAVYVWRENRTMRPGLGPSDVPAATRWLVSRASQAESAMVMYLEFAGLEDGLPPRIAREGALLTCFYAACGKGETRSSAQRLVALAEQRLATDPEHRERFQADVLQKMEAATGR